MSTILNYQQSHLDLNKIESINKSQLVDLMNNFIISYLDKLKSLIVNVDLRLFNLNSKIITCQSNLCILEARISRIPGLNLDQLKINLQQSDQNDIKQSSLDDQKISIRKEDNFNQDEDKDLMNDSNDNPDLSKYKKMLSVGVPLEAVKIKMRTEGFDPNLLK